MIKSISIDGEEFDVTGSEVPRGGCEWPGESTFSQMEIISAYNHIYGRRGNVERHLDAFYNLCPNNIVERHLRMQRKKEGE